MRRSHDILDVDEHVAFGCSTTAGPADEADEHALGRILIARGVDAGATIDRVGAKAANDHVVAIAAIDRVVTAEPEDRIVAAQAENVVGFIGDAVVAIERVVTGSSPHSRHGSLLSSFEPDLRDYRHEMLLRRGISRRSQRCARCAFRRTHWRSDASDAWCRPCSGS